MSDSHSISSSQHARDLDLARFRIWLSSKPLRKNTLLSYNFRIEAFKKYTREVSTSASLLSPNLVIMYLNHLKETNSSRATISQTIVALSKMFQFAGLEFPAVERPAKQPPLCESLSLEEIRLFLEAAKKHGSLKARIISLLCFEADLTASQCLWLNRGDVQFTAQSAVRLKRRGELVKLSRECTRLLFRWHPNERSANHDAPLFLNEQGRRITRSGIDYLIKSVGIPVGLVLSAQLLRDSGRYYRSIENDQTVNSLLQLSTRWRSSSR